MAWELRAQLSKGVFELYSSAYNLAADSLKKLVDDNTRSYINNRRYYYSARAFVYMKESINETFQKTGEGYGKQIAYLGLACDCLNVAGKDVVRYISLPYRLN